MHKHTLFGRKMFISLLSAKKKSHADTCISNIAITENFGLILWILREDTSHNQILCSLSSCWVIRANYHIFGYGILCITLSKHLTVPPTTVKCIESVPTSIWVSWILRAKAREQNHLYLSCVSIVPLFLATSPPNWLSHVTCLVGIFSH